MAEDQKQGSTYALAKNGSFSGADMKAYIIFPEQTPISIGEVSTITYSTYRETHPVRTIGRINPKGFSRGPRTIAGTIIFTVFQKHVVNRIKKEVSYLKNIRKLKPGELPPFDIMISMGNEYGESARIFIYGIEVVDEGKVFSVEDLFTENTWSYMARDIDLMDDIDAEQNAPIITLGERDQSGIYDKNDLVLDKDLVEMNKQIQTMLDEKKAAVEEVRNQNKDYIQGNGQIAQEELVYPDTGSNEEGWIPPDDFIGDLDKCGEFFLNQTNKWEQQDGNSRSFYFKLNIVGNVGMDYALGSKDYMHADSNEFKIHKQAWGIEVMAKCAHGGMIIKTLEPKLGTFGAQKIYARFKDNVHAERPRVFFRPSAKYVRFVGVKYQPNVTTEWTEIAMDTMANSSNPIAIEYARESSKQDQATETAKNMSVELNAVAMSRNARKMDSSKNPINNTQCVYKDVSIYPGTSDNAPYKKTDGKWLCGIDEYTWAVPQVYEKAEFKALRQALTSGFNITASFKRNGTASNLTNTEKKNTVLTCTSSIRATIMDPKTGKKDQFTLEGSKQVGKVKIQTELFDGDTRDQKKWKWNDLAGSNNSSTLKLPATGTTLGWAGGTTAPHLSYSDMFYRDVHISLDNKVDTIHVAEPAVLKNKCSCGFVHGEMELVLKNFKIELNGVAMTTTLKVDGKAATELRFPVDYLDAEMHKYLEGK